MRILIDARMMGPENTRGIGRYTEELIRAMLEVAPQHCYVLVVRQPGHPFTAHPSVETMVADIPWYSVREQLRLPGIFYAAKADIVHIPHWNIPLLYWGPLVITVHDLLLRHEPASAKISTKNILTRNIKRVGYRIALDWAMHVAKKILVPTEFVSQDVARFYPQVAHKVVITGEGMPRPIQADTDIHQKENHPYFFYVGAAYPHKGLADLLAAWPKIAAAYPELSLKIGGERDVFMRRHQDDAAVRKLERVEFLGRVPDADLPALFQGALSFVFPSHFEGFGLPPLEALASGCPVISSDAPALREVLGNQGVIFFRAGDPDAILTAVREFMRRPQQIRQEAWIAASALAIRHDWKRVAALTLDAYAMTM